MAQESPGGLLMPNQALLYTGRVHACSQLPGMMHLVRDLCGCQISLVPSAEAFRAAGSGEWLSKYFRVGDIEAEDRRKMLAYARDLLNSDYAGHRLTFQLFAQSPPFSHLLAVYNNYDFGPAVERMAKSAGLEDPLRLRSEALA
jgi:4-hydroxyphenylacetate 3-monooxygenase